MNLRVIPTKAHGAIDMATGPALVAAPTLFRMNGNTGATVPPRVFGTAATLYSLLTDYEFGLKRVLPMRAHLALDVVTGVALAGSALAPGGEEPTGVASRVVPAVAGLSEVLVALMTRTEPPRRWRRRRQRLMFTR